MRHLEGLLSLAPVILLIPALCLAAPVTGHARRHSTRHVARATAVIKVGAARPLNLAAGRSYAAAWRPSGDDRLPLMVNYRFGPSGLAASFGYHDGGDGQSPEARGLEAWERQGGQRSGMVGATVSYHFH